MASLTNNDVAIQREVRPEQEFVHPAPATPSPLTSVFDALGNAVTTAKDVMTSLNRDSTAHRAALDEAAKNNAIKTIAATVLPVIQPTVPPESQGAYNNSQPLAAQAANAQTAATQGKIDPSMAQAKSMAAFRQALAANPGHEFAVFQAFKEAGVDNMMMQQYKNAESSVESAQTAQQSTMQALENAAVTKWGYTNYYQQTPDKRAEILATVGNLESQEKDLDMKTKLADLTSKNYQLTQQQRDDAKKLGSSQLFASTNAYMTGSIGNLMKISVNLLGDPTLASQPGRQEQLVSHLMSVGLPALDAQYQQKRAQLVGLMTNEDLAAMDKSYADQRKAFTDMISGPQSIVEMNKRVMDNITNSFGIDYAKAAPTVMKLQKMVGPQAIGVLLSPAIQGNKPLMDLLGNELKGAIADPSKMPSFTEFVQSLNGTVDPATWDPEKARALAPASLAATNRLAMDAPTMNGTDKDAHKALMNSIKNTAGVAVDVVPQWGFGNVLTQSKALNTRGVTNALFNTGSINQGDKVDAVRSWIPATTRSYQVLSGLDSGDKYYKAVLDPHTLQWKAVWNGQTVNAQGDFNSIPAGKQIAMGINPNAQVKPSPSSKVLDQVATLNTMLNNLSHVAQGGWDDSLSDKSIPYNEARRYFATGQMPPSLQPKTTGKGAKTPEQNVDDAISHAMDFVNKLQAPEAAKVPGAPQNAIGPHPYAKEIGDAAVKYNVPPAIAASLFHTENRSGNPNATSDKGARGLGQVTDKTAAAYGVPDQSKLSPAEQTDLALHILSDNYKRTGNWADALSMYHSGHDLKTATAHNMTDGHMKTSDYVSATMAAASSISPENLQKYGYKRY